MQRLNKEYKLNINDSINLIYGSVDRLNPQVIYLSGKTWILPQFDGEYETIINLILNNFKKEIRNNILNSTLFSNKYICDFDLNTLALSEDKNTFMSFDIFVKQKNQPILDLKSIKPFINGIFSKLINNLENNFRENAFMLSKSKQK